LTQIVFAHTIVRQKCAHTIFWFHRTLSNNRFGNGSCFGFERV